MARERGHPGDICSDCHPGQALRQQRAVPGPKVQAVRWVPAFAALSRDDNRLSRAMKSLFVIPVDHDPR